MVEGLDYYNGLADLNCLYSLQNTKYEKYLFKILETDIAKRHF